MPDNRQFSAAIQAQALTTAKKAPAARFFSATASFPHFVALFTA
ncbi:hypothetical protein [Paenibacillus sp. Y412MC10]|nr:hypothetical protein [Paenibacillus sp. Y412MC10]